MTASNPNTFVSPDSASTGIRDTRSHIAALRETLLSPVLSPDQLIACLPGLSQAAANMAAVEHELLAQPAIPIDLLRDLKSLKSELGGISKLIELGAAFHRGWARVLGSAAGYTASGDAAPLAARGSVVLEG